MYMHITFTDETAPYILHGDKADVATQYRRYARHYGDNICVLFDGNGLQCRKAGGVSGWAVSKYFDGAHHTDYYQQLANALNRLQVSAI